MYLLPYRTRIRGLLNYYWHYYFIAISIIVKSVHELIDCYLSAYVYGIDKSYS